MSDECRREFLKKAGLGIAGSAAAWNEVIASATTNQSQMRWALNGVTYTGS